MKSYKDRKVIKFMKFGWPLNETDPEAQSSVPPNQKGAQINVKEVQKYLRKEREAGSIIGPFTKNPFGGDARFSPLDTREKKDSTDLRVILNLSHPFESGSVNHSINKEEFEGSSMKLVYPSIDDLAKIIKKREKMQKF